MRCNSYLLSLVFLLITASCAPASIEEMATPTPTLIPTPSPTETIVPTPVSTPTLEAGQWSYIFYHEGLEQIVLVNGGPERGKPADDPLELWGWDGEQWSLIRAAENGPIWRNWPAAAYDNTRDVLVIHGGLQTRGRFDETWEWDGKTWTQFAAPGGREGALMAYDQARAKMVLFGGADTDMNIHGDTWEWDGATWTKVSDVGPEPRFPGGMVYDAARREVLMYSGHFAALSGEAIDYDDLWAWDGSSWRKILSDTPTPGHRTHAGFVYDPVTENVLLIGSGSDTFVGDVWSWDGTQWTGFPTSNTPIRTGLNVAYDPKRDRFVLFGGVDRPGGKALDDTWEWDRENWVCVSNCK